MRCNLLRFAAVSPPIPSLAELMAQRKATSEAESLRGLLADVRKGSRQAFDRLVDSFWEPVMLFFWKRVSAQDAEDLAQDVFAAVYRAVRNGEGPAELDLESWRRYLFASARNALRSHWRRKGGQAPAGSLEALFADEGAWQDAVGDPGGDEPDLDPLITEERSDALRDCLERVDEAARSVCWLHFAEGRSKREIAAALGVAESSLRDRLTRTLQDLRRCLKDKGMEPLAS